MPEETRPCSGAWHRHGQGANLRMDSLPISEFAIDPRTNKRFKTCQTCRLKSHQSNARTALKRQAITGKDELTEQQKETLQIPVDGGRMYKWLVTKIQTIQVTVYARDFLSAGVEAGEGEITNVERLS